MITSKRSIVLTTRKIIEIETKKYIGIYINEKKKILKVKNSPLLQHMLLHNILELYVFFFCFCFFLTGVGVTVMSGMTANNF